MAIGLSNKAIQSTQIGDHTNYRIREERSVVKYTVGMGFIIVTALIAGILTNKLVNLIGNRFNMGIYGKLFIQIIIIGIVLFFAKKVAHCIPQEPDNNYSYDIMFIAVFMTSQENFQELLMRFR